MSRLIFPIIAGLTLILIKVLPELATQAPRIVDDVPIRPRVVDDVPAVRHTPSPQEVAADDLLRAVSEVPIRDPEPETIARLESSPVFRSNSVPTSLEEGPKYSLDRIAAEISQNGTRNIREYAEYVEATHAAMTTVPRSTGEFQAVFGRLPSANETDALLSEVDVVAREFKHVGDEASLLRSIEEQDVNFITIIGHNEDGVLRLPYGSSVNIETIAEHCASVGKKCIFLSCNSSEYLSAAENSAFGVDRRITFRGAHMIADFLSKRMQESSSMSYMRVSDDLQAEINVLAQAANVSDAIATSAPPVLVAGGIGGVYFAVSDEER